MTASDSVNDWSCDDATAAQLRPAGSLPAFVPFARWNPERSYKGAHTLRYNVEWKLFVKNRERAGQSELDIVLSPKDLWKHVLQPKLIEESTDKPWKEGATLFILSANDRKTKSIKKRYATHAKIEWPFVAKTLQEWGKSLGCEKTLTVDVKFYYELLYSPALFTLSYTSTLA